MMVCDVNGEMARLHDVGFLHFFSLNDRSAVVSRIEFGVHFL